MEVIQDLFAPYKTVSIWHDWRKAIKRPKFDMTLDTIRHSDDQEQLHIVAEQFATLSVDNQRP